MVAWFSEREREKESSICLFTIQMFAMAPGGARTKPEALFNSGLPL